MPALQRPPSRANARSGTEFTHPAGGVQAASLRSRQSAARNRARGSVRVALHVNRAESVSGKLPETAGWQRALPGAERLTRETPAKRSFLKMTYMAVHRYEGDSANEC